MSVDPLIQDLINSNHTYRRLYEEHQKYEARLQDLIGRPYLNQDENLEEKELKKKKLQIKDEMSRIVASYRAEAEGKKAGAA
jgi:uncharacterized protein YdcH (DUF465 family)